MSARFLSDGAVKCDQLISHKVPLDDVQRALNWLQLKGIIGYPWYCGLKLSTEGLDWMATLSLVRIDQRLIHGQVMAMWSKEYPIDHILVIDDPPSKDPFAKKIYGMAVPSSIKVYMLSVG